MIKRIILILLVICAWNTWGFCKSQEGKPDGINREYYPDGKLKFEYMVKDEELNGFFEKYDEGGNLEYREYYIDGVFDGVDHAHYYYPLFFWYQHIGDEDPREDVLLTEEEALEKFGQGYGLAAQPLEGNWMGIVRTRLSTGEDPKKQDPVTLAGITPSYIYLKEYKDKENVEPSKHYFYDLIEKYKVPRSYDIDELFNVAPIVEMFQRVNTAVEFGTPFGLRKIREGSRLRSVQQYMGEPDYIYPLKPAGWFDVYYEFANLHILGHSSAVYFIEEKRPDWAKLPKYRNKKDGLKRKIEQIMGN